MKPGTEFLKSLIEVAHIEFQTYDLHRHKLIFSSGLAQKILGYSRQEYYKFSRNFYEEIIHPDDLQKIRDTVDKLNHSSKGEIVETTARFLRSDGNYIWLYTRKMVSRRNRKGDPCTITTVAEDVTELVGLQEQLRKKVHQLESISYKNSHLLRNPVANILGLISLIEEQEMTSTHNIEIFHFLKLTVEKLDKIILEINDLAHK